MEENGTSEPLYGRPEPRLPRRTRTGPRRTVPAAPKTTANRPEPSPGHAVEHGRGQHRPASLAIACPAVSPKPTRPTLPESATTTVRVPTGIGTSKSAHVNAQPPGSRRASYRTAEAA
jgi:hypothetical protein